MSISFRACWLASTLVGLPLFACATSNQDAGVSFKNGWRPAHVLQRVEREALANFAQVECGQDMASMPDSYQRFAVVSYHPWSNPKLKARRIVPVDDETTGKVGDHVMIFPRDCHKPMTDDSTH